MVRFLQRVAAMTFALVSVRSAAGQIVKMPAPNAKLTQEFSDIRGVRELPDGRVLVSDYRDQRVVIADFDRGTITVRITEGGGPLEARLPTALIPAPGDTTVLVDMGNERLSVIDADGRVRRTISGDRSGIMGLRGVDRAGRYYFAIPGWMERGRELANDSVRVVGWNPRGGAEETIAIVQGERMRSDIRSPAKTPRIPTVGYGARDAWVVDQRGGIRIVRAGTFSIETRIGTAAPVVGPSYAYETAKVTQADRIAYVRRFNLTSPMSGRGEGGGLGFSPPASDAEIARQTAGTEFAERHPMFDAASVRIEPTGRLWVGLPVADGRPTRYDLFDLAGQRTVRLEFPPRRRVMSVSPRFVYAIAESDDGLEFLERYPLPK